MGISFTIDLEDPTGQYRTEGHYAYLARRLLDLCDEMGRRATFFTVGRVADASPKLMQDIAARGHEIAYHSHNHVSLTKEDPTRFRRESRADKDLLEQLTGKPVTGFRAPRFSLTPQSVWAVDALGELGFRYSSSIMPTGVSLYGFTDKPRTPFRWPNGLVEFPLPVADVGSWRFPYLGGVYLYTVPAWMARRWTQKAKPGEVLWTYTHPYDFDREQPLRLPNTPLWIGAILWTTRRIAEKKIRKILAVGDAPPLGERLEGLPL